MQITQNYNERRTGRKKSIGAMMLGAVMGVV